MKTLASFCKLESDLLAKFTIRLKSQSEQYKAITLRNVIDGSVLMACNGVVLELSPTSILFISVVGKFRPNIEFTPFHDFLISPRFVSKYLL